MPQISLSIKSLSGLFVKLKWNLAKPKVENLISRARVEQLFNKLFCLPYEQSNLPIYSKLDNFPVHFFALFVVFRYHYSARFLVPELSLSSAAPKYDFVPLFVLFLVLSLVVCH